MLVSWLLLVFLWCILGLACACLMRDCVFDDFNPLWKIPLALIGPLSFVVLIFIGIYNLIKNYIKEIKDYYADKKAAQKRIEERRKMIRSVLDEYYEKET